MGTNRSFATAMIGNTDDKFVGGGVGFSVARLEWHEWTLMFVSCQFHVIAEPVRPRIARDMV